MKVPCLVFFLLFAFLSIDVQAQININNPQKMEQKVTEERLAKELFNKKEYDKAKDIYLKLYNDYKQIVYFNQYIDCLVLDGDLSLAERSLRTYLRGNNSNWRAKVLLGNIYILGNEYDKADKYFVRFIREVPKTRRTVSEVASIMRSYGLEKYALQLYEDAAEIPEIDYQFYLERAYCYQSMLDFENATEMYLRHLEKTPKQYDMVKNRIRVMMMYDMDGSINDIIRTVLLANTQKYPDNIKFSELLMWFSLQMMDYDIALMQAEALDRRTGDRESDIFYIASIAEDNKEFEVASDAYNYIVNKHQDGVFYLKAAVALLNLEYLKAVEENINDVKYYESLSKRIDQAFDNIGFFQQTRPLMLAQAEILAYHLDRIDDAVSLLERGIALGGTNYEQSILKMRLADIYLYNDEIWEATLLYSQVDKAMKDDPLGHEARLKNARLRYYIGEFQWAVTVLDILKSATSKLVANDAMTLSLLIKDNLEYDTVALRRIAKADYYIYQKKYDIAEKVLDSVCIYNPNEVSLPVVYYRKAQIAMTRQDYSMADSLFRKVYEGYAGSYIADEALMDDAEVLEKYLDRKDDAMRCYEMLMDTYTASVYVAQARKNYRRIRDGIK